MTNIKKLSLIAMVAMTIVSLASFFGYSIAGISIVIGIAFVFINNTLEKKDSAITELDARAIRTSLKDKTILIWIVLPLIMNVACMWLATLILPEYIEHLYRRTDLVVPFDKAILLVIQLAIFALGEEMAWRAFFQQQLNRALPLKPTLIVTSIIFAFGHIVEGSVDVIAYDIFFIMINSVLYGVIFHKTKNAWISATSHFIANLFSIMVLLL